MTTTKKKDRPTVPEVMPLVNAFYRFEGNEVGGCLHVVLDDDNIEDNIIECCIEDAQDPQFSEHWGGHDEAGELLARLLLLMSTTQRLKLARNHNGYGDDNPPMAREDFIERCRALLEHYSSVATGEQD